MNDDETSPTKIVEVDALDEVEQTEGNLSFNEASGLFDKLFDDDATAAAPAPVEETQKEIKEDSSDDTEITDEGGADLSLVDEEAEEESTQAAGELNFDLGEAQEVDLNAMPDVDDPEEESSEEIAGMQLEELGAAGELNLEGTAEIQTDISDESGGIDLGASGMGEDLTLEGSDGDELEDESDLDFENSTPQVMGLPKDNEDSSSESEQSNETGASLTQATMLDHEMEEQDHKKGQDKKEVSVVINLSSEDSAELDLAKEDESAINIVAEDTAETQQQLNIHMDEDEDPESFDLTGSHNLEEISDSLLDELNEESDEDTDNSLLNISTLDDDEEEDGEEATVVMGGVDLSTLDHTDPKGENLFADDEETVIHSTEDMDTGVTKTSMLDESTGVTKVGLITGTNVEQMRDNQDYIQYHSNELVKLQATVRNMREDRDRLMKRLGELEEEKTLLKQNNLTMQAEIDDLKIELTLLRRRYNEELEKYSYELQMAEDKKRVFEEKNRNYQKELERLGQKIRIDFNKIREREKELEGQLELLKADTVGQITTRDRKILDLKRQIDALEFNMENMSIQDQKSKEDRHVLEDKLEKAMKVLRTTLGTLEGSEDIDPSDYIKKLKI